MTFEDFIAAIDDGVRPTLSKPVPDILTFEKGDIGALWTARGYGAHIEVLGKDNRMLRFTTYRPIAHARPPEGLTVERLDAPLVADIVQRVVAALACADNDKTATSNRAGARIWKHRAGHS